MSTTAIMIEHEGQVNPAPAPAPLKVKTISMFGKTYEICSITAHCHTITALHTGAVRQYRSPAALWGFVEALAAHLERQAAGQERAA